MFVNVDFVWSGIGLSSQRISVTKTYVFFVIHLTKTFLHCSTMMEEISISDISSALEIFFEKLEYISVRMDNIYIYMRER